MAVPTSYNNIKDMLGIKTTKTVSDFIQYVIESYMIFDIYKYNPSLKKQYTTDKKIYVIDNGLRNAVAFCVLDDLGKLFENMVYIELKRQNKTIFFAKN
jgi:predicted AAA+ superfamily ATPase